MFSFIVIVVCFSLLFLLFCFISFSFVFLAGGPSSSMSCLNPANLSSWSVDDVCYWLISNGLGNFIDTFRDNEVDGECLLTLDNKLLRDNLGTQVSDSETCRVTQEGNPPNIVFSQQPFHFLIFLIFFLAQRFSKIL